MRRERVSVIEHTALNARPQQPGAICIGF